MTNYQYNIPIVKKKISNSYVKNTNKNAKIQQQINKKTATKVKN